MSNTIAKIKQSQGKSERGFRPSPRTKSSNTIAKKTHKSSKVKGSLNEVLSHAQASPQTKSTVKRRKKSKNQGKRSQVRTRFSPFATQDKDKDKDKETDDQDYDKEKKKKTSKRQG
jgi:hypothetical protein